MRHTMRILERQPADCGCGRDHDYKHHHEDEVCGCGHDHSHKHHNEDETCGCGHEHHNEDEACRCGHDHGHKHHNEDEACRCGHDHGHKHHNEDETCGCGHDHGHEHRHGDGHVYRKPAEQMPGGRRDRSIYYLENLGCANCAAKMEEKIGRLPGVASATITYATKELRLEAEDPEGLASRIEAICTSIEPDVRVIYQGGGKRNAVRAGKKEEASEKREGVKTLAVLVFGAALFAAGLILEHAGAPVLAVLPVHVAAYLLLGVRILWTAFRNLTKGHVFDENFLMSLATLGAFAIGDYPEAVGVMLFYRIGEFFEERAVAKSRSQIMDAVDLRPEVVNLETAEGLRVIGAEEAKVGDLLLVRPGDRIPLDGVIVEGESRIDTSPITGEPVPVRLGAGDAVTSGCVNTSGQLKLRVEKVLEESMVTRILQSVENAAASKPKMDRFITRFARIYTPVVVAIAVLTAVLPSLATGNWDYWVYTALSFLVMSCPCALVLSVPLAFFSGIGAGSREGILFKGGLSIEAMSTVKAVVMDKTGTVTEGNFIVQEIVPAKGGTVGEQELLALGAGCERHSTHPIAASIVQEAKRRGAVLSEPERMEEIAGHGIRAFLDGREVLCGNGKLLERFGVFMEKTEASAAGSEVFIAVDGVYAGRILVSDTIKKDAGTALIALRRMGVKTAMLTGDREESARAVAGEIGLDEVRAKLLPEEKLSELKNLRETCGPVMYVGDGINDAPVLAGADVGAAMGSGADAALEAADVVFMTSAMEAIPQSIRIARNTRRISWQNVVFALIVKAAVMLLGLCGFASMWAAVFADTGVAMMCVLNSIRILYRK